MSACIILVMMQAAYKVTCITQALEACKSTEIGSADPAGMLAKRQDMKACHCKVL